MAKHNADNKVVNAQGEAEDEAERNREAYRFWYANRSRQLHCVGTSCFSF
jgi:hypothetical protein